VPGLPPRSTENVPGSDSEDRWRLHPRRRTGTREQRGTRGFVTIAANNNHFVQGAVLSVAICVVSKPLTRITLPSGNGNLPRPVLRIEATEK